MCRVMCMQVLQDRLEAVELMLMQRPIVSGRFTDYAHRHFVQPLDAAFRDVCARSADTLRQRSQSLYRINLQDLGSCPCGIHTQSLPRPGSASCISLLDDILSR